jgi:hypothetical protein
MESRTVDELIPELLPVRRLAIHSQHIALEMVRIAHVAVPPLHAVELDLPLYGVDGLRGVVPARDAANVGGEAVEAAGGVVHVLVYAQRAGSGGRVEVKDLEGVGATGAVFSEVFEAVG